MRKFQALSVECQWRSNDCVTAAEFDPIVGWIEHCLSASTGAEGAAWKIISSHKIHHQINNYEFNSIRFWNGHKTCYSRVVVTDKSVNNLSDISVTTVLRYIVTLLSMLWTITYGDNIVGNDNGLSKKAGRDHEGWLLSCLMQIIIKVLIPQQCFASSALPLSNALL